MENKKNNPAKFAFFYMLSLVALIFLAISSGMIIFQIINKLIPDFINQYSANFSPDQLKFAISAIIISAPIYFFTTKQIIKNLFNGDLDENSEVRKWLTYFILFISSVVMIGWFIGTINSFLNGELTSKFILKALTAIVIAGVIFSFYFYDIKREEIKGKKDNVIKIYFIISLVVVLVIFLASLFFVESPANTRSRKIDEKVLFQFNQINNALNEYFIIKEKLPNNFKELSQEIQYLNKKDFINSFTGKTFDYYLKTKNTYELCNIFLTSNKNNKRPYPAYKELWPHNSGYQCLKKIVKIKNNIIKNIPQTVPIRQ